MKKNVLFVLPSFEIGGTVVSTKNLILLLDKSRFNVTVLPMKNRGKMEYLYSDINLLQPPLLLSFLVYNSWKEEINFIRRIACLIIRFMARYRFVKERLLRLIAYQTLDRKKYDVVIACQEGICTQFVSSSKITNSIAWVRCDYSRYKHMCGTSEYNIYNRYKSIICVSESIAEKFIHIYPQLMSKVYAINNPQSSQYIIEQSENDDNDSRFNTDVFTLVSIGRFDPIKRFDKIPKIASFLVQNKVDFKWYIIGDGAELEKKKIVDNIVTEGVENNVYWLGIKTNPHYYIRRADLLVVLSSSEACPRVINEAKILHTPTVCADFDTAREFISDGENGVISSIDSMKYSILEMIQDTDKYDKIKSGISNFIFDNSLIMEELYRLLDK